jgi:hypothetical protein
MSTHRVLIQTTMTYEVFLDDATLSDYEAGEYVLDNIDLSSKDIDLNTFVYSVERING